MKEEETLRRLKDLRVFLGTCPICLGRGEDKSIEQFTGTTVCANCGGSGFDKKRALWEALENLEKRGWTKWQWSNGRAEFFREEPGSAPEELPELNHLEIQAESFGKAVFLALLEISKKLVGGLPDSF